MWIQIDNVDYVERFGIPAGIRQWMFFIVDKKYGELLERVQTPECDYKDAVRFAVGAVMTRKHPPEHAINTVTVDEGECDEVYLHLPAEENS